MPVYNLAMDVLAHSLQRVIITIALFFIMTFCACCLSREFVCVVPSHGHVPSRVQVGETEA